MLLGLRTVIYPVTDLAAATSWWSGVLGIGPYFQEPFYVGFEVGGYELGLLPVEAATDGPVTYWGVADVEAAVATLTQAGATAHESPRVVGDDIRVASVREPAGNLVGLIFNPHFAGTG